MKFMLDTHILIYFNKNKLESVAQQAGWPAGQVLLFALALR